MTPNKNFSSTILFLWAITALLPTIMASKVALRDPCNLTIATLVIEIVYTSSGVSSLPTITVTQTFTSTSGVPYSTPPGSGSGSNNGGGSPADQCATTTQYSIAIVTVERDSYCPSGVIFDIFVVFSREYQLSRDYFGNNKFSHIQLGLDYFSGG
ncbi:hypothetical protein VP1G_10766 [Cytospora mali]|uniref:Uncharacterized protein n=1 Tax=Cytospora mali TaxID=578113 RepID=A0A194UWY1_CYTMA|nr:hypothetical protein VP1G_10766 [Valsa mali var. pyri (nom. inval.)]